MSWIIVLKNQWFYTFLPYETDILLKNLWFYSLLHSIRKFSALVQKIIVWSLYAPNWYVIFTTITLNHAPENYKSMFLYFYSLLNLYEVQKPWFYSLLHYIRKFSAFVQKIIVLSLYVPYWYIICRTITSDHASQNYF